MKKCLIGLIVGIIFAALIISGVVYLSKPKTEWKTYENKEWGFRIKYPQDWELYESRGWRSFYVQNCPIGEYLERGLILFRINAHPSLEKSLEEIAKDFINFIKGLLKEQKGTFKLLKYENVTLGGAPAIHVEWIGGSKGEQRQSLYFARYDKKDYGIEFTLDFPTNWESYIPLMEKMVKSFEFIEVKNEK
jgi:hypothetical protein